jgi:hypothetical protein
MNVRALLISRALPLTLWLFVCASSFAQDRQAKYVGELVWKPLSDGRLMQLVQPFGFEDKNGVLWSVPSGFKVDGATIPRSLWPIVGPPFTGKYRDASVIHDYYCATKTRDSDDTHLVFYEAMLVSGEDAKWAKLMYYAVVRFGPRWQVTAKASGRGGKLASRSVYRAPLDDAELQEIEKRIQYSDVPLAEIKAQALKQREGKEVRTCSERFPLIEGIDDFQPSDKCRDG